MQIHRWSLLLLLAIFGCEATPASGAVSDDHVPTAAPMPVSNTSTTNTSAPTIPATTAPPVPTTPPVATTPSAKPTATATELKATELAAALDLALEFGKHATELGSGDVDEDDLAKQVAKRHKMSVEDLDRAYLAATVQHAAEITKAMNDGAK